METLAPIASAIPAPSPATETADSASKDASEQTLTSGGGGTTKTAAAGDLCSPKPLEIVGSNAGDAKDAAFRRFVAGDLVWGRLKLKQWWPGTVVHSSNHSKILKNVEGGERDGKRVFVSFFGGSVVAWCPVVEIKPFVEVFGEMVEGNNKSSFVSAVREAVEAVRLSTEIAMSCECVSESGLVQKAVREEMMKPVEFVRLVHVAACDVTAVNSLEIALLKCWVVAFGKGWGNGSPGYQKRLGIEELVDNVDTDEEVEEDGLRSSGKSKMSNGKLKESNAKKRSVKKLVVDTVGLSDGEEMKTEEKKGRKRAGKRKVFGDDEGDFGVEDSGGLNEEEESASSKRERKMSKYLSPPYTNKVPRISSLPSPKSSLASPKSVDVKGESATTEMEEDVTTALTKLDGISCHDILIELYYSAMDPFHLKRNKLENAIKAFFARYRSSMYTGGSDIVKCMKESSESHGEDFKSPSSVSANSAGDGKSKVKNNKRKNRPEDNSETDLSPDLVKSSQKRKYVRKKMAGNEAEGKTLKVIDTGIVNVPVMSRYENLNNKDGHHKENAASFPVPTISHQPAKEGENVIKTKEMSSGQSDVHGSSGHAQAVSGPKKKKAAAIHSGTLDLGRIHSINQEPIGDRYPGALLLNFSSGVPFPSREELISTFCKYGVVIESETELQKDNGFARIVFARSTDAEKAYNSSDRTGIFCPPHVAYRIRYLSPITSFSP